MEQVNDTAHHTQDKVTTASTPSRCAYGLPPNSALIDPVLDMAKFPSNASNLKGFAAIRVNIVGISIIGALCDYRACRIRRWAFSIPKAYMLGRPSILDPSSYSVESLSPPIEVSK